MRKLSRIYNPINNLQISFQTNCKSKNLFFLSRRIVCTLSFEYVFNIHDMCKNTSRYLVMLSIKLRMLFIHLNYMRMFTWKNKLETKFINFVERDYLSNLPKMFGYNFCSYMVAIAKEKSQIFKHKQAPI